MKKDQSIILARGKEGIISRIFFCLVFTFFLIITYQSDMNGQTNPSVTIAEAREVIAHGNIKWGKARVEFDTLAFNEMLAPDFYVNMWGRNLTREEFIRSISTPNPNMKFTRFDATVLTVQQKDDQWIALIHEKLEHETPKGIIYALWITKDGWKKVGDKWIITFSEAIGREYWREGTKPPFKNW